MKEKTKHLSNIFQNFHIKCPNKRMTYQYEFILEQDVKQETNKQNTYIRAILWLT